MSRPLELKAIVFAVCAALCLAITAADGQGQDSPAGCQATLVDDLALITEAKQVVTVLASRNGSQRGSLRLWRKSGGCWTSVSGPWQAWLGARGVALRRREGDRTTPAGVFGLGRVMYGVGANPGVRYAYRRIVCGDWWVEDPRSPHYNRFRHVRCGARPPFRVTSGDMSRSPTAYRHLAVIRFNTDPVVPGRGSGIFLHASLGKPTSGCISLPLGRLVRVLRWLRPASRPLIAIGTRAQLRSL